MSISKEPLNNSATAGWRVFCPIRAVPKLGNTQSIPAISVLSAEPKSLATSSCRIIQRFLRNQAVPFFISSENSKRALNIYRVFRKLSYVNQPGFLRRRSLENPGFFYFQKGRWLSAPDFRPFSCFREDGFFRFLRTISRAWKRAPEEMEVNREKTEQWKYQTQTNQTRIPFPHGASRPDGEARLYGIPTV